MTNLAIVGCGEVGLLLATGVMDRGAHELTLCDVRPASAAHELAHEHDLALHTQLGSWLAEQDLVWSCVPGDVARPVAEQALVRMRAGALFVDLSTASPEDKRSSAWTAGARRVRYAEGAIMGAVGLGGLATPMLLSGEHAADAVEDLAAIGAPVRALQGGRPGDAVVLKLLRTVITKGLEALGVEALVAAECLGVREELTQVLTDIDEAGFTSFMDAVVRTHVLHAERRGLEVSRAAAELAAAGLPSLILDGAQARFTRTAAALACDPPPAGTAATVDATVAWLLESATATPATGPGSPSRVLAG